MYCPQCKTEYKENIKLCSDCQIPLIENLQEENHDLDYDYIEILSTLNQGDIALIKSILSDGNIDYLVFGEEFNSVRPLLEPARFIVRIDQAELAKELLKDFEVHIFGVSKRIESKEEDDGK